MQLGFQEEYQNLVYWNSLMYLWYHTSLLRLNNELTGKEDVDYLDQLLHFTCDKTEAKRIRVIEETHNLTKELGSDSFFT